MNAVFAILSIQALVGAFDNFWHHELEAKLPRQVSARYELRLHAAREAIYGVLFLGLAWLRWDGAWAWVLAILLAAEVLITLADFIEEDMTRRLPPLERVLHTVLAISYGGFVAALAPVLVRWASQPTGLTWKGHGAVSLLFSVYAAGVLAWSVRNAIAVVRLSRGVRPAIAPVAAPRGPAVLVTGATGFIGSALVRDLVADGQRVIVLTRDARRAAAMFGPHVVVTETLDAIPGETPIEAVVNLAGASILGGRWSARRRAELVGSRVDVTRRVAAMMRRLDRPPLVLVNASAVGFYGVCRLEGGLDETALAQAGTFQSDLCAVWEREAMRADARVVCLRFGGVLGKGGGVYPPLALASRLGLGAVLGGGDQPTPWIHLDDAIGLIRFAIDMPMLEGPVNAVAPHCPPQAVFARTVAGSFGTKVRLRVPAWPLWRLGGEAAQLLLDGQAATPKVALAAGYRFLHRTLESATADLAGRHQVRENNTTSTVQPTSA
ncbi:TIGR01777 family oxidoreductase [Acidisphaera sp. S103]|uniref:TIGR01777 family oxidoreductase n=1 Tax=Acidisphaera sp. S103 TaxID=1747223 RepID=UPI00131C7ED7|nr:TIGR01777 family oxidoreductase [Acidisphaera sp. S103]